MAKYSVEKEGAEVPQTGTSANWKETQREISAGKQRANQQPGSAKRPNTHSRTE